MAEAQGNRQPVSTLHQGGARVLFVRRGLVKEAMAALSTVVYLTSSRGC